jgi:hypothetical protein
MGWNWPRDAYRGQRVICIEEYKMTPERKVREERGFKFPAEGGIYTIRDIRMFNNVLGCTLEEIRNPEVQWKNGDFCECYYKVDKFRPLEKNSTFEGMKILRKLLEPRKEKEKETVK